MSWQCTSWALREAECPSASARLVLIALADRCQPDGRSAWPSTATLMREAHCSEATVRRALRDLEAMGTIRRGNQLLAQWGEHGGWIPERYRSVVWECCMHAPLEEIGEREPRDESRPVAASAADEDDGNENPGYAWDSPSGQGCRFDTPGVEGSHSDTPEPVSPVTSDRARGVTGDRSIVRTEDKQTTPYSPPRGTVPEIADPANDEGSDAGRLCSGIAGLMAGSARPLPVPAALSSPSARELKAARRLVGAHGLDACLAVARWALRPPVPGARRGVFSWRSCLTGCVALERKWDRIAAQMADDPEGRRMLVDGSLVRPAGPERPARLRRPEPEGVPDYDAERKADARRREPGTVRFAGSPGYRGGA